MIYHLNHEYATAGHKLNIIQGPHNLFQGPHNLNSGTFGYIRLGTLGELRCTTETCLIDPLEIQLAHFIAPLGKDNRWVI